MNNGGVLLARRLVGARVQPRLGGPMAPGERLRVRYVHAMRMVSVVRRGVSYELGALLAGRSHTRFGVAVTASNAMRITGASTTCAPAPARAPPALQCRAICWLVFAVRL